MARKGTVESPHLGLNHEPVQLPERPADFEDRYVAYVNGQIEELLTWYGPIDYLWFDGSAGPKVLSLEQIRKLQPGIIVNDRQHGRGDVVTSHYEYKLPDARPAGWWEHCFSMVGAWGYTKPEHCAPTSLLLSKLARVRTWGGNVLANYGPRPDGEMPDCFYRNMAEMKDWMAHSGTSLVGRRAGTLSGQVQRAGHRSRQDVVRPSAAQDLGRPGLRGHDRTHRDFTAKTGRDACHGKGACRECRRRQAHDRSSERIAHRVGRCCCD